MSKFTKFLKFTNSYIKKSNNSNIVVFANVLDLVGSLLKLIVPIIILNKIFSTKTDKSPVEKAIVEYDAEGIIIAATCLILANIIPTIRDSMLASVRSDLQATLSEDMLHTTYDMKLDDHLSAPTGEFAQLLRHIYISVEETIPNLNGGLIPSSMDLLSSLTGSFITNYYIGLIQLGLYTSYIASSFYNSYKIDKLSKIKLEKVYAAYGGLLSAIDRYQVAHHYDNVDFELDKSRSVLNEQKLAFKNENVQHAINLFRNNLIAMLGLSAIISYEFQNLDTPKNLILLSYFLFNSFFALSTLGNSIQKLYVITNECEEIIKFLRENQNRIIPDGRSEIIINSPPSIEFKNVNFSYQTDQGKQTIQNINFKISSGQKIAIVGKSGAGKSTLIKLLLRFYDPDDGNILINDTDIKTVTKKSLRQGISVVSQNPHLFNGTIAENIKYGDTNASYEAIQEAANLAGLDEWNNDVSSIRSLEENIGANGDKISSGEKQRVALARALMKSGHIFLFDEATSSLDVGTERNFLERFKLLTSKETVLVVTHRLSTIVDMDKIIYMENGKIVEAGTFSELMAMRKCFYKQIEIECLKLGVSVRDIYPKKLNVGNTNEEKQEPSIVNLTNKIGIFCQKRRNERTISSKKQDNLAIPKPKRKFLDFLSREKPNQLLKDQGPTQYQPMPEPTQSALDILGENRDNNLYHSLTPSSSTLNR